MINWIQTERPKLHFAPQNGWINDPNGLIYDGRQYHLFAQHNPADTVWGPMHWLHAVSDDLLHWKEIGIALYPDHLGTIFSGSAVIDTDNTAGFGPGAIIAMYTLHGDRESQGIAYSLDGIHFTPYEGNPVIENPGIADFRDPKVFWNASNACWTMALAARDCIAFYRSKDMRAWRKTGSFGKQENYYGDVFECPDLFPLTAPDGRTLWVLLVSMAAPAEIGGSRMQYYLGEFDGETFHKLPEQEQAYWVDTGFDNYAGVTYYGTQERVYIGWAASPTYAGKVPAGSYRGCMTLPRKLSLVDTNAGVRLAAEPMVQGEKYETVLDGTTVPNCPFELSLKADGPFEVLLSNELGHVLRFGLNDDNSIYTDRTKAGASDFDAHYDSGLYSVTSIPRLMSGPVEMRVIMDHTLVELFADKGTYVHSALVFPTSKYSTITFSGKVDVQAAAL